MQCKMAIIFDTAFLFFHKALQIVVRKFGIILAYIMKKIVKLWRESYG